MTVSTVSLGKIKLTWKGEWQASTTYAKDDVVKYGASAYIVTTGHTSTQDFLDNTDKLDVMAEGVSYRGYYAADTRYKVGDIVTFGSYSWICTQEHQSDGSTEVNPGNNTDYWNILAKGQEFRGEFTTSSTYAVGDIVKQGARVYICTLANEGVQPTNTDNWTLLTDGYRFIGEWANLTEYYPGDVVRYNGQLYAASDYISSNLSQKVSDSSLWYVFSGGFKIVGSWTQGFEYYQGDVVRFGGNTYVALQRNIWTVEQPITPENQTNWSPLTEGINYRGEWGDDSTVVQYRPGDLVKYGAELYRASASTSGTVPENGGVWVRWSYNTRWRGDFELDHYRPGDVVRLGGNLYLCIKTAEGVENPPVWGLGVLEPLQTGQINEDYWLLYLEGISYQGQWGATTEYNINEVVEYAGGSYICQRPNVGQQPDQTDSRFDWDLLVAAPEGNVLVERGDIIVRGGVTAERLPVGPAGSFLYSDGTDVRWGHLTPQQTFYVSTEGDDTNDGRTPGTAWRTLEYACEQTYSSGQTMISVFAGTYEELVPIRVGRNVVIEGAGLGAVTISPDNTNDKGYGVGVSKDGSTPNANSDVFWMNNGARLRNVVFRGFGAGSVCTSLDPGYGPDDTSVWITSQSPYVQNCTSFTPEGTGMWVDGARHNGGYKSMVANDWTQINSDGIGIRASSDAKIELVSVFTYYCDVGFLAESGAKIRSVNGSSAYGEFGIRADGFSQAETPLAANLQLTDDTINSIQTQENDQHFFDVYKDELGNQYASGFTSPTAADVSGGYDFTQSYPLVTKFNPDGSLDWSYTYEGAFGAIHSVIEIDQSIYCAGVVYDSGQNKGFLLKISRSGEIQWQKVVSDTAEFVDVASDEAYLYAVGNHATQGATVVKVSAGGVLQWSRTVDYSAGSINTMTATSCDFAGVPTSSTDSYAAEGNANAANTLWIACRDNTNNQSTIVLMDATGAQVDAFNYGDFYINDLNMDLGNGDGIYAMIGGYYDNGGNNNPLLARIAMTGEVAWQSQLPVTGVTRRVLAFGNDVYAVGYKPSGGSNTNGWLARYTSAGAKDWIYEISNGTDEIGLNGVELDGVNVVATGTWNDDSVIINVQRDTLFDVGTVTTGSWAFSDASITPTNTTVAEKVDHTAYVQSLSVTLNNGGLSLNAAYPYARTVAATRQGFAGIGTGINFSVDGLTRKPKEGSVVHIDGDTQTYFCIGVSNYDDNNGTAEIALDPAVPSNKTPDDNTPLVFREAFSQVRMTGHDFLDIGTGGFADTNYPVIIAEDYTQSPSQARETLGEDGGRVFYVTTDQDGNFRVGDYFKVEQATGRATLSSEEFDLSGLNELQLGSIRAGKQGATVNEFSTDGTMAGNSDEAVPTERAVVTYLTTKLSSGDAVAGILQDATGSTKVQVKETPNENVIRFDTSNTERLTIDSSGQITAASAYVPSADADLTTKTYVDDKVNLTSNANNSVDVNQTTPDTFTVHVGNETEMTINTSGVQLAIGERIDEFSSDGTMAGNSNTAVPTEAAIVSYVGQELGNYSTNSIFENDSNVTVADSGTGAITLTTDGSARLTVNSTALTSTVEYVGTDIDITGNIDLNGISTNGTGVLTSDRQLTNLTSYKMTNGGPSGQMGKTFRFHQGNSSNAGTTWRKVCDVTLANVSYSACEMHIKYEYHGSNYGINANNYITYLVASFQRDSGAGSSNVDSAVLYGNNTTNVRIMKTATGVYELQARANVDNQAISLECTVLSEKDSTVTPAPQGGVVAGSTTGTEYLAITSSNPIVNFEGQVRANEFRINSTQVIDSDGALQNVTYNGNTIWHSGNDGPTSGLSAQYVGGLEVGQTGSSYVPYVDGNGRMGIGRASPLRPLHVAYSSNVTDLGDTFVGMGSSSTADGILIHNTDSTAGAYASLAFRAESADGRIAYKKADSIDQGAFHFITEHPDATANANVTIGYQGHIGVGTLTPQDGLHLAPGQRLLANVGDNYQQSSLGTNLIRGGNRNSSISNETTALTIFNAAGNTNKTTNNYSGGIKFMHLDPDFSTWGTSYTGGQAWIGLKIYDTPAQERSSLVLAVNNNTGAGSMPSEAVRIDPNFIHSIRGAYDHSVNGYPLDLSSTTTPRSGYVGDSMGHGYYSMFRAPKVSASSSGSASSLFATIYSAGHWGCSQAGHIYCFTTYYGNGYRKYAYQMSRGGGFTLTEVENIGSENACTITASASTVVGTGTYSGQSVHRVDLSIDTNTTYVQGYAVLCPFASATGMKFHDSVSSDTAVNDYQRNSGGPGYHLRNFTIYGHPQRLER